MDSGLIGANEFPKKNKWSDNCKVYTRKVFRNPKKTETRTAISGLNEASVGGNDGEVSEKLVVEVNNGDEKRVVNGTGSCGVEKINESVIVEELPVVTEQNVEKSNDEDVVVVDVPMNESVVEEVPRVENRIKLVRHGKVSNNVVEELPVEEAVLSKTREKESVIETVTLSGDSGDDRVEEVLPNGHDYSNYDGNMGSGVVRDERRMVTQVDDRLNISVSAAKSREEVRDLKRKLEDELLQVRKMARKLEAKENQLSNVDFDGGSGRGRVHDVPAGVNRLHVSFNGGMNNGFSGMRSTHETGSFSYSHPRGYGGERSVSAMDNSYYGGGEIPQEKEKRTPKANKYYPNTDFVLGKDKLPTGESSRKAKSGGGVGRKSGGGEANLGFGFDKKIHKKCSELLQKLQKHKHGWVFNQPVDVERLGLHDYYDIIRHPMDLGTVKTKLTTNWYKTPREFAEHVRLTFHNAMTYNPEGQDVHIMAKELLRLFNDKWPAIDADYERRLRYEMFRSEAGTPTPTSRKAFAPARAPIHMPLPQPPILHHPPVPPFQETRYLDRSQSMPVRPEPRPKPTPSVRTPALKKPKAKDPDKRDMTFDEKQKLSNHLQQLPSEKLDVIVQIIKKRNTALSQHDDEIEVDIDSVDTETLWELDRFVTNHRKSASKRRRKLEIAEAARESARVAAEAAAATAVATAAQAVTVNVPIAAAYAEPSRVVDNNRADEVNVAAPPHVPEERHSDSSGSSSSSSGSGSSSSDSDSSSSSDSGSDQER